MKPTSLGALRNEIGMQDYDGEHMSLTNAVKAIRSTLVYVATSRVKNDGAAYVARHLTRCELKPPSPHSAWSEKLVREIWTYECATMLASRKVDANYQRECDRVKREISS